MVVSGWIRTTLLAAALAGCLGATGCAPRLASWIVQTRDRQGAHSLETQRYKEAAHAFRLALQLDPDDATARGGFVEAQAALAETFYQNSQFAEALQALDEARKVDPQSVRVAGLAADVANARLNSEIVHSNYAGYRRSVDALLQNYALLKLPEAEIAYRVKRFGYTYDAADLTRAIRASGDLEADVSKLTARLTQVRALVSAGTVSPQGVGGAGLSTQSSLLPLP